jgi:tRNA 5-methylaminomethyl-2-thiouridine biosynthesis bifunctional protein
MRRATVVGAGLAGASVARALAILGWRVTVLESAATPAAGASGLPAGLMSARFGKKPSVAPSAMALEAARVTRRELHHLSEGRDWAATGAVLMPTGEVDQTVCWVRPAALVHHWLSHPDIAVQCNTTVPNADALACLATEADAVVVCAGPHSKVMLPSLDVATVRGQVSMGPTESGEHWPEQPVRGDGTFIPAAPIDGTSLWLAAASYEHDRHDLAPSDQEHDQNRDRVRRLLGTTHPAAVRQLEAQFDAGQVRAWVGLRCTTRHRQPIAERVDVSFPGRVYVLTALGSRGITIAALLGQQLAQRIDSD